MDSIVRTLSSMIQQNHFLPHLGSRYVWIVEILVPSRVQMKATPMTLHGWALNATINTQRTVRRVMGLEVEAAVCGGDFWFWFCTLWVKRKATISNASTLVLKRSLQLWTLVPRKRQQHKTKLEVCAGMEGLLRWRQLLGFFWEFTWFRISPWKVGQCYRGVWLFSGGWKMFLCYWVGSQQPNHGFPPFYEHFWRQK